MAATVTLGTGGLAAFAAGAGSLVALAGGAALAGAIGLGVAGLAASLVHRGGRSYGGYRGNGHYHGHGHVHSHGGYGYRGRRSAEDESQAIQNLLDVIRTEDVTGCGLRLVCELAGLKDEEIYEEELAILNLVGPITRPGEGILPPGGAGEYMAAKSYGMQHGNCARAFPLCPFNSTELMGAVMRYLP